MTINEAIRHCEEVAEEQEQLSKGKWIGSEGEANRQECEQCAADHRQLAKWLTELKEAKRLLKMAVEDFAKFDRENTKNKNCMMPEMDCADCPLSWDSVDDRVEPCHSWRYTNEVLKLIQNS